MYFAKNLRFLRRKAELSQSDLGDKLATDYNTISRYENGKSTPKLEALTKLAQLFQVSIEALRDEDLTKQLAVPAPLAPEKPSEVTARIGVGLSRPAKHALVIAVELDGTQAGLARAVARLTAINEVVADTD
jgi:transcriptional regulator with XRE-family HTH domain